MIEAKGPEFARMLRDPLFDKEVLPYDWSKQARSQILAAGNRRIEWYFAEPEAAARAKEVFDKAGIGDRITIHVVPALVR